MFVEVECRFGRLRGRGDGRTVNFLGVPYAQPPQGVLRWKPPAELRPWHGVRDALVPARRAYQLPFPSTLQRREIPGEMSEDMLQLNIHTPGADGRRRPVLVYIHGGGYTAGSANDFDPSPFAARHDIVVVSINYRLGLFGFLDLGRFGESYAGSASLGFQDQIAALRFVREVIGSFGGDPEQVTVCGVSAGAGSVLAMLGAPAARGLFRFAMAFSPGEVARAPPTTFDALRAELQRSDVETLEHLHSLSGSDLFALQARLGVTGGAAVDGQVIVAPVVEALEQGINPVPLLVGTCIEEGAMLVPSVAEYDLPGLEQALAGIKHTIAAGHPQRYEAFLDTIAPAGDATKRMTRLWYDYFRAPTVRAAAAASEVGVPAWVYSFEAPTDHPFGPTHSSEMPFTFSLFDGVPEGALVGFHRNNAGNRALAHAWSDAVARFVRTGDPNGSVWPAWPSYRRDRRATLVIQPAPEVRYDIDPPLALRAYGAM